MKKGISLITLVITIVVIIILSAVVILSLNNGGVIDSARIATLATDHSNLQTSIELYLTNVVTSNLDMDFDKEKILLGNFDDSYRIVEKDGENLIEAVIEKNGEEITVYKLDQDICKDKGIEFPNTPSNQCDWYIAKDGQVYLVYEENATISAWIIGNPPEGKQIENETLDKFVTKIGEWENQPEPEPEPNIYDIIPVADANMFKYTNATNGTVSITGFNSEYTGEIPNEIKFPTTDPNGNTVIGISASAFANNTNLTTIIIPEGVTTVGAKAFLSCTALKQLYIPSTVATMGYNANSPFYLCDKIEKLYLPQSLLKDSNVSPKLIFTSCKSTLKEVKFVGEITTIVGGAFYQFTALEKMDLPDTLITIGSGAFQECVSLAGKLIIPQSVTSIGEKAFYDCNKITEVKFLSKSELTSIGTSAFYNLGLITSIYIPEGVTTVGAAAFSNCASLKEVYIPSTVTTMGYNANSPFYLCDKIEKLSLPQSLLNNYNGSPRLIFTSCKSTLKEVKFVGEITTIVDGAFYQFTAIESIDLPDTLTSIGSGAFEGCVSLGEKLIIPQSVTSIGQKAFYDCNKITEVKFLSKGELTSIGASAFYNLGLITSIYIPEGVTTVGATAFSNCASLKEVYIPSTVTTMGYNANSPFYLCDKIEKLSLPQSLLTNSNASPKLIFTSCKSTLKEVNFVGEVTTIVDGAFYQFIGLETIKIPDTVTTIGSGAFSGCTNLKTIVYSGSATGAPWGATNATVVTE